jgi:hypothetical protein
VHGDVGQVVETPILRHHEECIQAREREKRKEDETDVNIDRHDKIKATQNINRARP